MISFRPQSKNSRSALPWRQPGLSPGSRMRSIPPASAASPSNSTSSATISVSSDTHSTTPRASPPFSKKELPASRGAEFMSLQLPAVRHVGVIGAGTMGAGIATSCIASALALTLVGSQAGALESARGRIDDALEASVKKGRLTAEAGAGARKPLGFASEITALGNADVVIEAVYESLQLKQDVFRALDSACRADTLLATNTSTLDVAAIASVTARPQDVIGMHFFSPANIMRLIE